MTDAPAAGPPPPRPTPGPIRPGLEGVIAGETSLSKIDGERGTLLYRGYRIGDLVEHGTYAAVANLLWTGEWDPAHRLPTAPLPDAVLAVLRALPPTAKPMDALRTAVSAWGATQTLDWPPTVEQARALTAVSPSALAAFARLRQGLEPIEPDPVARPRRGLPLPAQRARDPTPAPPGRSTPTSSSARSTASTPRRSRRGSSPRPAATSRRRSTGAIGTMKGPLHGGAPSEVVDQLHQVGSPEHAEAWVNDALDRRRAADGLRPPRLPRVRPAGRRAAQGRRVDAEPARLARARDRRRGRRAARPRRAAPGPAAQDQRRVLRRARAAWASA